MRPSAIKDALKATAKAGLAIMIHGQPGVGKSQVVHQMAKEIGYKVIDVRLSQLDPVDLRGIPFVDVKANQTKWIPPEFLPREEKVLLFLDEINSAPQGTQAAAYQLILDRKLGSYSLPEDTIIIAAGNRLQDRAIVHQMSSALKNRLVHLDYDCHLDDWCDWAVKTDLAEQVLSFIRFKPTLLNEFDDVNKTAKNAQKAAQQAKDAKAFATPRSWEFVSKMLKVGVNLGSPGFMDLVAGAVGEGPAAEFIAHMKFYSKLPDLDLIILSPDTFTAPKNEPQLCFAIATGLAARASKDNIDKLIKVAEKMDEEYQVLCMKDVMLRDLSICQTAPFKKWAVGHRSLFT